MSTYADLAPAVSVGRDRFPVGPTSHDHDHGRDPVRFDDDPEPWFYDDDGNLVRGPEDSSGNLLRIVGAQSRGPRRTTIARRRGPTPLPAAAGPTDRLLSLHEVAALLGRAHRTVQRMCAEGELRRVYVRSKPFVRLSDLNAYVAALPVAS